MTTHTNDQQLLKHADDGGDRVVLVISVPVHEEMLRARVEIPPLVQFPELLRFRRWQPAEQETEWTLQWVLGLMRRQVDLGLPTKVTSTGPDPESGLIMITLDRVDPTYAAELEARGTVSPSSCPNRRILFSLAVAGSWSPYWRVPDAASPTWVTVEKVRLS